MNKLKQFITSLELRLSDLLFVIGFIPLAIFLIFGQLFMQYPNPDEVDLKLWAIIPLFIVLIGSWGAYIVLEYRRGNKVNRYINAIFIFVALWGVIGILSQPINHSIDMIKSTNEPGDILNITMTISPTHYIFFVFDIISIVMLIYIGLFILPKRFGNITFIKYLGYAVIGLSIIVIFYSYIAEHANYIPFLKALFAGNITDGEPGSVYEYAVKSFIIHRNAFGMMMLIAIIMCFINHSIENKWFYFPLAFYFLISEVFSFCKTSLLISVLIIIIYVFYRLIYTYKKYPKRNKIILICLLSAAVLVVGLTFLSYVTKGKILGKLYSMISSILGGNTIDTRFYIWTNSYQLLNQSPLYYFTGRGFGLLNLMLLPMNIANGDTPMAFPTHSGWINLLAEGGIFYLLAYILLLGYYVYVSVRCFKKDPSLTIALALGTLSFFVYSFIETIHYLVYVFMFPVFIHYHVLYKEEK